MIKAMRTAIFLTLLSLSSASVGFDEVPADFRHDRVFVEVESTDGLTVGFYTDSGGGFNAIRESTAERLRLETMGDVSVDQAQLPLVRFPSFLEHAGIPRPRVERWLNGGLVVVPDSKLEVDGFLGSRWFEGKVWKFDYDNESLSWAENWTPDQAFHATPMGFRSGSDGVRNLSFPRISISVDGESFDMLLDTGATAKLAAESAATFELTAGTRIGISYISAPVFERWAEDNPSWRVIEGGDDVTESTFPMIEIPEVVVAGVTVGPVWFAQRPEGTFEQWMSQMTDAPVIGAVGGSLFRHFRMVLDYPNARAHFQAVRE